MKYGAYGLIAYFVMLSLIGVVVICVVLAVYFDGTLLTWRYPITTTTTGAVTTTPMYLSSTPLFVDDPVTPWFWE